MAKIWIIEDESLVAMSISMVAETLGHEVYMFHTVSKILEAIEQKEFPELAIFDINLGADIDGITVAQKLKEVSKTEIIFLTAYSFKNYIERAKAVEPAGYILKPFKNQDVALAITMVLNRKDKLDNREVKLVEEMKQRDILISYIAKEIANPLAPATGLLQGDMTFDAVSLCNLLTTTFKSVAENKGVTLDCDIPQGTILIKADVTKLEKLLTAFLSLSIQKTQPGGKVFLILAKVDKVVAFNIIDEGEGMTKEEFNNIINVYDSWKEIEVASGITLDSKIQINDCEIIAYSAGKGLGASFLIVVPQND